MAARHLTERSRVPAVVYLRMSSDKQEASIAAQREAVHAYAEQHGYHILREYIDEGISGDDTAKRKAFQRMIADADAGEFKAVLCWDVDRFGRFDSIEAGRWIYPLRQAGVALATVAQGRTDWNDFASRMIFGIQQEAKHAFLRDLSRNVVRGHLAKAKLGLWQGGIAPYGYRIVDRKIVVDPATAPVVRRIFAEYADHGTSLRSLADKLNNEKIPSPGGKKWRFMGIRVMLMHDVYVGTYTYAKSSDAKYNHATKDGIVEGPNRVKTRGYRNNSSYPSIPNNHEAIVSPETFAKVQRMFKDRKRDTSPYKSKRRPYLLTGLCRCGHCGNTLIGAMSNYHAYTNRIYVCSGYHQGGPTVCSRHYVKEEAIVACVLRQIAEKALSPRNQERLRAAMLKQLANKQTASPRNDRELQDRIAKLDREIAQGADRLLKLPEDLHDVLVERLRTWRTERDDLRTRLDAQKPQERTDKRQAEAIIEAAMAKLDGLRERLQEIDPDKLRTTLREVVDRVELFFEQKPYGTRKRSELTRGVIYLSGYQFTTLSPCGSTLGSKIELSLPFSAADFAASV